MLLPRRYRRRVTAVTSIFAVLVLWQLYWPGTSAGRVSRSSRFAQARDDGTHYCPPLPGIEDVLVVVKTGATEALRKVPVHFNTTLSCVADYVIFSDFEEEIGSVLVRDAFQNMSQEMMLRVPDFDIYNRLKAQGRSGLVDLDFADEANSAFGKRKNRGWKLDKWKFLPMVRETLRYRDDAKWYVFIETDTYVMWPNFVQWLARFRNPRKHAWYMGAETKIGDTIFAHGGSGFVMSNKAMRVAADAYRKRTDELHMYTNAHWAGDCVLGKVLYDEGVKLHFAWPIVQNSNLGELDEFTAQFYRRPWCFPAVAFHHLTAEEIEWLWAFEQSRWKQGKTSLLHADVYEEIIHPKLLSVFPSRQNWDNLSQQEQPAAPSFEDCQSTCSKDPACAQYLFKEGKCYTHQTPRLGRQSYSADGASAGPQSGWMVDRIQNMLDKARSEPCPGPNFGF